MKNAWMLTIIGALSGLLVLVYGVFIAPIPSSAGTAAAVAVALAVIPYCLARACQQVNNTLSEKGGVDKKHVNKSDGGWNNNK